ncbi:MAG: 50S ribosomal protein L11 methyltransferase [Bacteroidota bacterium]
MQYKKVTFTVDDKAINDILIARLSEEGFDGFEEAGGALYAYVPDSAFNTAGIDPIADSLGLDYEVEDVPVQNWNEVWESNFEPVVIEGLCTIRADFHQLKAETPYEIIITPKMSFGTGHHATTHLVMVMMKDIDFNGKSVLDFGTGTGVLAIFAEKLGAAKVKAIDNDEWPVENARENIGANGCRNIEVVLGSLESLETPRYDVILANINRHILLQYMGDLVGMLAEGSSAVLSGLLEEDEAAIVAAAEAAGMRHKRTLVRNGWIALNFTKKEN